MKRNRRWISEKIRDGYEIIDIGIDPDRVYRSIFYAMEKEMVSQKQYPVN